MAQSYEIPKSKVTPMGKGGTDNCGDNERCFNLTSKAYMSNRGIGELYSNFYIYAK